VSKLALAHEWIDARAGSEQAFESLTQIFPEADLFALSVEPGVDLDTLGRPIKTTWLDRSALRGRRSLTLPVMPIAWRSLRADNYDAVISSHHAFAHTNRLAKGGVHLSYVYSPARYIWKPQIDSRGASPAFRIPRELLKRVDLRAVSHVDSYAAISRAVADRISECWGREATIIHPPVRVDYFGQLARLETEPYLLGVGRWIPYKNLHLVIDVASRLGLPVKIAGRGPDRSRLEAAMRSAKVPVELIESPSDETLRDLYRGAAALVFPTFEDFGIVPVEAQAAGTPVVALKEGGALDTVIDGRSGILTQTLDIDELTSAVERALTLRASDSVASAARFTPGQFQQGILSWAANWGIAP
jgi:glycosyltransferase involved in cell wall biosynthesis